MTRLIDLVSLSRRVASEAAREPEMGRAALVWTFLNRTCIAGRHVRRHGVPHPEFGGGTVREACRKSRMSPADSHGFSDAALCRALATAALVSCHDIADPTKGATHYHHHTEMPVWSLGMKPVALIGSYLFYRPREDGPG